MNGDHEILLNKRLNSLVMYENELSFDFTTVI